MGCRFSASFVSPFADFRDPGAAPRFSLNTPPVPGRVVRVLDGDTVDFVTNRIPVVRGMFSFRCRLAGLDAPELHPPLSRPGRDLEVAAARLSAERLGDLLAPSDFMAFASFQGCDKYGRYLVRLFTPAGVDVNARLVSEGFARPYAGGTKAPFAPPA